MNMQFQSSHYNLHSSNTMTEEILQTDFLLITVLPGLFHSYLLFHKISRTATYATWNSNTIISFCNIYIYIYIVTSPCVQ
jgi:hypothetical protein